MASIRPLRTALNASGRYAYRAPELRIDHLVMGGGVVGLAIANALAKRFPSRSTYLVERHALPGQETSSRNSEVIHAGLYYPPHSLKTRMCTRGRTLLYDRIARHPDKIGGKQVGKLIVGTESDASYLAALHEHCSAIQPHTPPTRLLSGDEARQMEPSLSPRITHALYSPSTGIVSAHDLMSHLAAELEAELPDGETPDATMVLGTSVVRIDPHTPPRPPTKAGNDGSQEGWVVQLRTHDAAHAETDALLARVVINAGGLNAPRILNAVRPERDWLPMYLAKGSYASYRGAHDVRHLLYPTPHFGSGAKATSAFHSLGTHLTLDLEGHVRFGPDLTWLSAPSTLDPTRIDELGFEHDFWESHLAPEASEAWLESMHAAIQAYLPWIQRDGLQEDYAGIRPKLGGPDARTFFDFGLLWHANRDIESQRTWQTAPNEAGPRGPCGWLVSLVGVESPGLTSSLALGEHVAAMLQTHVWGRYDPSGRRRRYVDDVGHDALEAWA